MEYLDDEGTIKRETVLLALALRLKAIPREESLLAVPLCDEWVENKGLCQGRDRACQVAIVKATEGNWETFVVENHPVDTTEELRDSQIDDYDREVEIDEIYKYDGSILDKTFLDSLRICWCDDRGIVFWYKGFIWEDGVIGKQISGPTSDEEYEDENEPFPQTLTSRMFELTGRGIVY